MPIRIILQRIKSAQLLINGKSFREDNERKEEDVWIKCGEGSLIYIAFLRGTTDEEIKCLINKIFSNPLFRTIRNSSKKHEMKCDNDTKNETDILIVPQFSLGGKLKSGKQGAQYNSSEKPDIARVHYQSFCEGLRKKNEQNQINKKQREKNLNVNLYCGVFGNRQGLKIESDGPFTHSFDINMMENKKNKNKPKKADSKINDSLADSVSNASLLVEDIINMVERL